jgi:hypothetical protein
VKAVEEEENKRGGGGSSSPSLSPSSESGVARACRLSTSLTICSQEKAAGAEGEQEGGGEVGADDDDAEGRRPAGFVGSDVVSDPSEKEEELR